MLGQAMSAAVGVSHGWKLPFLYVSIPTCILSILVLKTTEDPPRAAQELSTQRRASFDIHHPDFSPVIDEDNNNTRNDKRKASLDELIAEGTVAIPKYKAKASVQKFVCSRNMESHACVCIDTQNHC
jgi:hypothetical protein